MATVAMATTARRTRSASERRRRIVARFATRDPATAVIQA
jgi:hypothetical protein